METHEQTDSRVRIEADRDGVRIELPGPRSRWVLPALGVLVVPATALLAADVTAVSAAAEVVRAMPQGPGIAFGALVAALLAATNLPLAVALVVLAYHAFGSETVFATPWVLRDVRRALLFRRTHEWPVMRLSGVRLSPMAGGPLDVRSVARHGILFEVDGKRTRAVAEGCTPAEAQEVLAAMQAEFSRPATARREV